MKTVMLVEDDDDIREAVQDALERRGYTLVLAGDGQQALSQLRGDAPAPGVILLDLTMPVMSGWELVAELDKEPALAAIPVVVLSAVANLDRQPSAARWAGILKKPISLAELVSTVARFWP